MKRVLLLLLVLLTMTMCGILYAQTPQTDFRDRADAPASSPVTTVKHQGPEVLHQICPQTTAVPVSVEVVSEPATRRPLLRLGKAVVKGPVKIAARTGRVAVRAAAVPVRFVGRVGRVATAPFRVFGRLRCR